MTRSRRPGRLMRRNAACSWGRGSSPWAVAGLMGIWLALVALGVSWWRHPLRILGLPVLALGIWFGVLTAGERLLGWTA